MTAFIKHFTLSRSLKGSDHSMSLEPEGMSKMCNGFKKVRDSIGTNIKERTSYEEKFIYKMRKSIVSAKSLKKDHILTYSDLDFKSPGGGMECYQANEIIGKKLVKDIEKEHLIDFSELE